VRAVAAPRVDPLLALLAGPLARAGGAAVYDGLPPPGTCAALAAEAWDAYPASDRQDLDTGDGEEGRGGTPARALRTAPGGPSQDAFYADPLLHALLGEQCGAHVVPSGNRGSFSYYVQPGDFLDLHLDIDTCDVTLITVLYDDIDPDEPAGALAVHPGAYGVPLSAVRERRDPRRSHPSSRRAGRRARPACDLRALLRGGRMVKLTRSTRR
jgi:hypothetical protein